jgi:transcription-repair coupling factor (superfamily II helicase)
MAERAVEKEDAMWDETKQKRWNELNERQQQGCLGDEEQAELDRLAADLERAEWAALQPALQRRHHEQEQLKRECDTTRSENAALATLAERQQKLLVRARTQMEQLLAEHEALKEDYQRVTGEELVASGPS